MDFKAKYVNSARMLNYIYKMCMVKMKSYNIYKIYEMIIKKRGGRIYDCLGKIMLISLFNNVKIKGEK